MSLLLWMLVACKPTVASEADVAEAVRVTEAWFEAVEHGTCRDIMGLSKTLMTEPQCVEELVLLRERTPALVEVERAAPHPDISRAVSVDVKVEQYGGLTILNLRVERVAGRYLVVL